MTLFFFFIRHTNQTLADEVGIDVTRHVVNNLVGAQPKYLGVRMEGADLAMLEATTYVYANYLNRTTGLAKLNPEDERRLKEKMAEHARSDDPSGRLNSSS